MTHADRMAAIDRLGPIFRERMRDYDERAVFPTENFDDLREAGLLALTAPEDVGGVGLWQGERYVEYYEILEALARWDSITAQLLQVHSHALGILSRYANAAQTEQWVRPIVAGGKILASVGSESAPKSTGNGLYTQELAPREDGDWTLNCRKFFASVGPGADYLLIWLAIPGDEPYPERTVMVIVPREIPEVEMLDEWDVLGMRATVSWGVQVTGLHITPDMLFGNPGAWVLEDTRTFTLGMASNHIGAAQGTLDVVTTWVRERPHLASSELVVHAIGDFSARISVTRAALFAAARLWESGENDDLAELESQKVLHLAKRDVLEMTSKAFDICGSRALFRRHPLEQMYRDARAFTLHTRDDHLTLMMGKAQLEGVYSGKGYIDGATIPTVK